jgi:hypothetical protein
MSDNYRIKIIYYIWNTFSVIYAPQSITRNLQINYYFRPVTCTLLCYSPSMFFPPQKYARSTSCINMISHLQLVPVTTAWRFLRLRMEERNPIWSTAANILNKQSRTADKGWAVDLGFGRSANNSSPLKCIFLEPNVHRKRQVMKSRRMR